MSGHMLGAKKMSQYRLQVKALSPAFHKSFIYKHCIQMKDKNSYENPHRGGNVCAVPWSHVHVHTEFISRDIMKTNLHKNTI